MYKREVKGTEKSALIVCFELVHNVKLVRNVKIT